MRDHQLWGAPLQFADGLLSTDKDKAYPIASLVERFTEEPSCWSYSDNITTKVLSLFYRAKTELSAGQEAHFTHAWAKEVERRWPAVSARCFECWKSALDRQGHRDGSSRPWALDFLCALPSAIETEKWFAWCFDEFLKRLAPPDGFRFGQSQDWVECLQEFLCWTGPSARRFLHALDQFKGPLKLDRVTGLVSPIEELTLRDRTCIALGQQAV